MIKPTEIQKHVDPVAFLTKASEAVTTKAVEDLLSQLPIVGEHDYVFDPKNPYHGWKEGSLHWYPVGGERGNAGRISLAGNPANPLGERTINSMEALIELHRRLELLNGQVQSPISPRDAVRRYFDLPPLEDIPKLQRPIRGKKPREYVRELAKLIRVKLIRSTRPTQYAISVQDEGIGQPAALMHSTLLSLGSSDKADKPYLIGVFGQGGSSTYAASTYSWVMSRRRSELLNGAQDGLGWTVIKRIYPKDRRDMYFAYLAVHPEGEVISFPAAAADAIGFQQGTRFNHINYDFGKTEPARTLYPALNHLLFDPVLPYELYTGPDRAPDPMYGNGYRLSRRAVLDKEKKVLDKSFGPQLIVKG